jgi:hypothetical protein
MRSGGQISIAFAINSSRHIQPPVNVSYASTSPSAIARAISSAGHPRSRAASEIVTIGRWWRKMVRMRVMRFASVTERSMVFLYRVHPLARKSKRSRA